MKIKVIVSITLISVCINAFAATEFNMSFSTAAPGGSYNPKNVVTAWVTQTNGTFVKTILRYANAEKSLLVTWYAAAGSSDADAVMGATRANHSAPAVMTATWDLKNKAGAVVPDGTYRINLEMTDGSRVTHSFNFVKDSTSGTRTNAGTSYFKNISIAYAPPVATNTAPVATAQSVTTAEDTAKAITLTATDAETNALTYAIVTSPAHGTLSGSAPNVTYAPATNYYGSDSFTFQARDASLTSTPATVSITVTPVNDPPVAQNQSVTNAVEDTAKLITLTASDVETNALTYAVVTGPAHGMLGTVSSNTVTYTPAADYNGADSFTFKANDGTADSAPATVSITVTAVNDAPVAQNQSVTNTEDTVTVITLVATDVETNALTYAVVTGPAHGILSGISTNIITYTPATNYYGSDSFTFRATDGSLTSTPATVTITVTPVNDPPVAQTQSVSTAEDTAKLIVLAAADIETNALTYAAVTGPAHGVLSGISSNTITYTPAANYNGADSFTFKANDGTADSAPATVSITVTAVNDAPVAQNQSVTNTEDTVTVITLGAADAETNVLSYAAVTGPAHGILGGISSNTITYTPATNYNGPDSFTFRATDGSLTSTPATVTITVTPVNDPPVAQAQSLIASDGNPLSITLSATDAETNALTYNVVSQPSKGRLIGTPPSLIYVPRTGLTGLDSFTFNAFDGTVTGSTAAVSITLVFVDSNSNGIPDSWQSAYGVTNAAADPDGDGASNYAEYMAGTDPTNKASVFAVSLPQMTAGSNVVIQWRSASNRFYSVLLSTNLVNGWSTLSSNIAATPSMNTYIASPGQTGPAFYRIRLDP